MKTLDLADHNLKNFATKPDSQVANVSPLHQNCLWNPGHYRQKPNQTFPRLRLACYQSAFLNIKIIIVFWNDVEDASAEPLIPVSSVVD